MKASVPEMRKAFLYAFYGDDFTGSTDVLEQLASNGIPTVLYLDVPSPEHLAMFPDVEAIGIAGDSRSSSPEWMSDNLPTIFETLKSFQAPITHYKVCSTFDSSATHGSIGRAIELGMQTFHPRFVPIIVGAPHLRRYVLFGHLFAASPDGTIRRIDRHPMSQHPVTPMCESDLRVHLRTQTDTAIGLIDFTKLTGKNAAPALERELAPGNQAVLFDTLDSSTQAAAGKMLWQEALRQPLFSASSSGLTAALIPAWRDAGLIASKPNVDTIEEASPLLVVSGSCSAATERQLRWAFDHGYAGIRVDPAELMVEGGDAKTVALEAAIASLSDGRNTILYTSLGLPQNPVYGESLGRELGRLLRDLLDRTNVRRVLICGGDTCSYAVPQLHAYALTWRANLQPGAPLCVVHADDALNGLEIVLKGGQVGTYDFFDVVRGAKN